MLMRECVMKHWVRVVLLVSKNTKSLSNIRRRVHLSVALQPVQTALVRWLRDVESLVLISMERCGDTGVFNIWLELVNDMAIE